MIHEDWIYFVEAPSVGLLKIGFARNVRARFLALSTGSPIPLKLLAVIKGGYEDEQRLHRDFSSLRQHGEWFTFSPSLESYIEKYGRPPSDAQSAIVPEKTDRSLHVANEKFLGEFFGQVISTIVDGRLSKRRDLISKCGVSKRSLDNWLNGTLPNATSLITLMRYNEQFYYAVRIATWLTREAAAFGNDLNVALANLSPPSPEQIMGCGPAFQVAA